MSTKCKKPKVICEVSSPLSSPILLMSTKKQPWAKTPALWARQPSTPPETGGRWGTRTEEMLSNSFSEDFWVRMASVHFHAHHQNHCTENKNIKKNPQPLKFIIWNSCFSLSRIISPVCLDKVVNSHQIVQYGYSTRTYEPFEHEQQHSDTWEETELYCRTLNKNSVKIRENMKTYPDKSCPQDLNQMVSIEKGPGSKRTRKITLFPRNLQQNQITGKFYDFLLMLLLSEALLDTKPHSVFSPSLKTFGKEVMLFVFLSYWSKLLQAQRLNYFSSSCHSNHFPIKEAESPLKKMIKIN